MAALMDLKEKKKGKQQSYKLTTKNKNGMISGDSKLNKVSTLQTHKTQQLQPNQQQYLSSFPNPTHTQ